MAIRLYPLASPKILFLVLCFFLLAVQLKLADAQEEETLGHRHIRSQRRCKGTYSPLCIPLGCSKCSLYPSKESEEEGTPYCTKCEDDSVKPEDATKYKCSISTEIPETKPSNFKTVTAETCAYQCNQVNEKNPDQNVAATFCEEVEYQGFTDKPEPVCACTVVPEEPTTTTEASTEDNDTVAVVVQIIQGLVNAVVTFVEDVVQAVVTLVTSLTPLVDLLSNFVPKVVAPVLGVVNGL